MGLVTFVWGLAEMPYYLTGMGALNCPGDPGCPGNPIQALPCCADAASAAAGGCDDSCVGGVPPNAANSPGSFFNWGTPAASPTFTQWLNAHSDMLMIGGAAMVGLLFLTSPGGLMGGRR
jgi:hypothetical protein